MELADSLWLSRHCPVAVLPLPTLTVKRGDRYGLYWISFGSR